VLVCRWHQHVGSDRAQRVVPDGCVDLIWLAGRKLIVAGPATRVTMASLPAGSTTVGVRFAPGAGSGLVGLPLSELCDLDVDVAELWGADAAGRLEEALADAGSGAVAGAATAQLDLLEHAVLARRADAPPLDRLVLAAAAAVGWAPTPVRDLGAAFGVSERQLLRRFGAAVGYGPKILTRVMRFQRFVTAAWADPSAALGQGDAGGAGGGLGQLALEAGYADQAHLSRECRRLAGVSPRQLLTGG
jgi:AraC-like DNA-binding protein